MCDVFLSPSSAIWYWSKGGDALRLGKQPRAWRKVMAAYLSEYIILFFQMATNNEANDQDDT